MAVGTSSGQYYDDEFDYHHEQVFGNSDAPVTKNPQSAANEMGESGSEGPFYEWDDKGEINLKDLKELHENAHKVPLNWGEIENKDVTGKGKGVTIRGPVPKPNKPPLVGQLDAPKELHIVRHGETEENEQDKIRGVDDVKLNEDGRKQALETAKKLKVKGIQAIVSSPLSRAKETAAIIGKELGITPTVNKNLMTWDVGNFTGKPCEGNNEKLQDYAENKPDEKVPGGESYNEFKDRAFTGIREAILENKDKKLALVTHHMVESSLEGWEKTGQDNPSLDLSKLFNDTDQTGSIRKMTMQPDSTIMQPASDMHPNTGKFPYKSRLDSFDDRFQGFDPMKESGYADPGLPAHMMPPGWWRTDTPQSMSKITGEHEFWNRGTRNPDMTFEPERMPGVSFEREDITPQGKVQNISDKQINPTMKSMRDAVVNHIMNMSEDMVKSLHDTLMHPENIPGTHDLGIAVPSVWASTAKVDLAKKMKAAGSTFQEIADHFETTRSAVSGLFSRLSGKKSTGWRDNLTLAEQDAIRVKDLYNRSEEIPEQRDIAERLGLSLGKVQRIIRENNLPTEPSRYRTKGGTYNAPDWFKEEMQQ